MGTVWTGKVDLLAKVLGAPVEEGGESFKNTGCKCGEGSIVNFG